MEGGLTVVGAWMGGVRAWMGEVVDGWARWVGG